MDPKKTDCGLMFCYPRLFAELLLILVLVGSGKAQTCSSSNPIAGNCDCHFIGACNWTVSPPIPFPTAAAVQPVGIMAFAKNDLSPHTTTICEGTQNTMAILYDCDLLIPLYSARVLKDDDMKTSYSAATQRTKFRETSQISDQYTQKNGDYGPNAKDQIPCYESLLSTPAGSMFFETNWYRRAVTIFGAPPVACNPASLATTKIKSKIHKGHLIASNYGKAAVNGGKSVRDTFTLSNIVPQFADMNSNAWMRNEQNLLRWASGNCASTAPNRRDGRLFIVVGVIPSTYGTFPRRYFGFSGFSDFQGRSRKSPYTTGRTVYKTEYRINVPAVMWTAACCELEEEDATTKRWDQKYITKAFWGENKPFNRPVYNTVAVSGLFRDICTTTGTCPRTGVPAITVFPGRPLCNV